VKKPLLLFSMSLLMMLIITVSTCYADDAVVLPKGRWRILVDTHFYLPFDERYNRNGDAELYAKPFNTTLGSNIGLPAGLNLGTTQVTFIRKLTEIFIQPAYGVTDKLSLGLIIPYYWFKNKVTANVDSSNANFGINNVTGQPFPLIPGVSHRATTEDIQKLLQTNFGIKRIETWQEDGIGDIIAGGRYQYFTSEDWRLAFTGGVRFPTGHVDDPNNLVDTATGKGDYGLLFQFQNDYMRQSPGLAKTLGFPNPGEWFINTSLKYEWNLPDKQTMRVCHTDNPFCPTLDDVRRKVGDVVEAELSPKIGFLVQGLNFSPMYKYGHKFKDHYSGDKPLDYGSISDDMDNNRTDYTEHIYFLTLTYTTIPLFVEQRFSFPLAISLTYRNRFAGSGGVAKSEYIGFAIQAFF